MPKEKVTVTLDASRLAELRAQVGGRGVSSALDDALAAHLERRRHQRAVDDWLAELDADHGPVATETLEWAARLVEDWADAGGTAREAG